MEIDKLRPNFSYVEMIHEGGDGKAWRWYRIGWEQTIVGWAVVRMYGRRNQTKRTLPPLAFESLDEAWPKIRSVLQKRLREGYELNAPEVAVPEVDVPEAAVREIDVSASHVMALPAAGVVSYVQAASMTAEEIAAYKQLALVEDE